VEYERFIKPVEGVEFPSEYDLPSDEIQDLVQRQPNAVTVKTVSLATAGRMTINEPGFGFVMYGFSTVDNSKYSEAFCNVAINSDGNDLSRVFPCKTGRGFRGSFSSLTLFWPADPNASTNSFYFIIFKSRKYPWIGGLEAL
jgi:hypothetical protein